jgi:hypothetical protein
MTNGFSVLVWNHAKIKMVRTINDIVFRKGRCSDLNK